MFVDTPVLGSMSVQAHVDFWISKINFLWSGLMTITYLPHMTTWLSKWSWWLIKHVLLLFQLEEDLENYLYVKLMGGRCKLKKNAVPRKFECQGKALKVSSNRLRLESKRLVTSALRSIENIPEGKRMSYQNVPLTIHYMPPYHWFQLCGDLF